MKLKYKKVKEKLIRWYEDESENRKKKARRTFEKCKTREDEKNLLFPIGFYLTSKRAYPKKRPNTSNTLITKYFESVPGCLQGNKIIKSN